MQRYKAPDDWTYDMGEMGELINGHLSRDEAYSIAVQHGRIIKTLAIWFLAASVYSILFKSFLFFVYMILAPIGILIVLFMFYLLYKR